MRAICVDDERALMERTVSLCRELPGMEEVTGFTRPQEALEWVCGHPIDLALLDVEMPGMTGIELAAAIKEKQPDTAVIFLTAYPRYAVDAFAVRASGYLLKPVTLEALSADVRHAMSGRIKPLTGHLTVRTFGSFDVFVDGRAVEFKRAKAKEILAFLAVIVSDLVYRDDPIYTAVNHALTLVEHLYENDEHLGEFIKLMEDALYLAQRKNVPVLQAIHILGEGWVGEEALAIAVYCAVKYSEDWNAALAASVNHNGDSDSTGAVCGNILGAHLGFTSIPAAYVDRLELSDVILKMAGELHAVSVKD